MRDAPRRDFRWINSQRLTGWLCTAVQFSDPVDDVIGRGVRWPDVLQLLLNQMVSQSWTCATAVHDDFILHQEATSHLTS